MSLLVCYFFLCQNASKRPPKRKQKSPKEGKVLATRKVNIRPIHSHQEVYSILQSFKVEYKKRLEKSKRKTKEKAAKKC